jgi:hypothetical protein
MGHWSGRERVVCGCAAAARCADSQLRRLPRIHARAVPCAPCAVRLRAQTCPARAPRSRSHRALASCRSCDRGARCVDDGAAATSCNLHLFA